LTLNLTWVGLHVMECWAELEAWLRLYRCLFVNQHILSSVGCACVEVTESEV